MSEDIKQSEVEFDYGENDDTDMETRWVTALTPDDLEHILPTLGQSGSGSTHKSLSELIIDGLNQDDSNTGNAAKGIRKQAREDLNKPALALDFPFEQEGLFSEIGKEINLQKHAHLCAKRLQENGFDKEDYNGHLQTVANIHDRNQDLQKFLDTINGHLKTLNPKAELSMKELPRAADNEFGPRDFTRHFELQLKRDGKPVQKTQIKIDDWRRREPRDRSY
jgi:hypothetical protein